MGWYLAACAMLILGMVVGIVLVYPVFFLIHLLFPSMSAAAVFIIAATIVGTTCLFGFVRWVGRRRAGTKG